MASPLILFPKIIFHCNYTPYIFTGRINLFMKSARRRLGSKDRYIFLLQYEKYLQIYYEIPFRRGYGRFIQDILPPQRRRYRFFSTFPLLFWARSDLSIIKILCSFEYFYIWNSNTCVRTCESEQWAQRGAVLTILSLL